MILDMFWCRNRNHVYYVGIYLFCMPKHTALVTVIAVQLCVHKQKKSNTPNSRYLNAANIKRQINISGQLIVVS